MILVDYRAFLDTFFQRLEELRIDVTGLELDHIAYQTETDEEYNCRKQEILKLADFAGENVVTGRRVGVFKLHQPLVYNNYTIPALELVAPKKGQVCLSALEHGEFVVHEDFGSFMTRYPGLNWGTESVTRRLFPLLRLELGKNIRVKFHHEPVLEMIKRI